MLENLPEPAIDVIIALMQDFAADPRAGKIDLGVGVYRDDAGRTPVMAAVKQAEGRILQTQDTKTYLSLAGDGAFLAGMEELLLGGAVPSARVAAVGTPGGTAAVFQLCCLVRQARPDATIWVSAQTWPNHMPLIKAAGLQARRYRYMDPATGLLDRAGLFADLAELRAGDVVLLHGCCHNPTGVDPDLQDWAELAALLERLDAVPFIDMAYQGLGAGLNEDAAGLRHLAARLPEVLIAASCSKNFGLYRERVGIAMTLTPEPTRARAAGALAALNRQNFAFPPDHGGRVVSTILSDPVLKLSWQQELEAMRQRVADNRRSLADALADATGSDRFSALAIQKGMFSLLPLTPEQVLALRKHKGIYMLSDGRANMAGLTAASAAVVAREIAEIIS